MAINNNIYMYTYDTIFSYIISENIELLKCTNGAMNTYLPILLSLLIIVYNNCGTYFF